MSYLANCGDCVHRMGPLLDSDLSNYGEQLCGRTGGVLRKEEYERVCPMYRACKRGDV